MLETSDLTVRFGGHVAVNAVSCAFQPGTLTAIVGPNGAGKTTYFNLISGQIKASAGRVKLNGVDISTHGAPARAQAGLGRAFQLTNLFPNLTVRENVRLAVQARAGAGLNLWRIWSDRRDLVVRADEVLELVGLGDHRDRTATINVNVPGVTHCEMFADLRPDQLARAHELWTPLHRLLLEGGS